MISFVWSPHERLPAGTGGSENYTVGQVRELNRRGIAAQVVTVGLGVDDGRSEFADIPFLSLPTLADIGSLDDPVVFVSEAPSVRTRRPSYQILHVPPPIRADRAAAVAAATRDRTLIATSHFAARMWARFLDVDVPTIQVVYPFAEPGFAAEPRVDDASSRTRVLYAGRLTPEKGIYTLLAALHSDLLEGDDRLSFTVTAAGSDRPQGRIIETLLEAHPGVTVVPARRTPAAMAALMAEHDVVVMPSNGQYWHETFGIVSIEAQHAGCRVVASDDGGLPETDCGAVLLVAPDNAEALAAGIVRAVAAGPVPPGARTLAGKEFTVAQSVDALLGVFARPRPIAPASIVRQLEELVRLPSSPEPVIRPSTDPTAAIA
ncbi:MULTISPECIES: glycosyltransferase family 4 protein [Nocardioides]|uniref:Glycosyltransferase family 4 protein n=1 Tax=Nocardioides vastitatis TaxID=2568655 RepID=A0ABW0Z983_9ACTN|nr:glycosyltransferase family 4 protein [Nocardioides sp.]THI95291.1 glycosyltransferase family 4 protein [Nocardioides sp.]